MLSLCSSDFFGYVWYDGRHSEVSHWVFYYYFVMLKIFYRIISTFTDYRYGRIFLAWFIHVY